MLSQKSQLQAIRFALKLRFNNSNTAARGGDHRSSNICQYAFI